MFGHSFKWTSSMKDFHWKLLHERGFDFKKLGKLWREMILSHFSIIWNLKKIALNLRDMINRLFHQHFVKMVKRWLTVVLSLSPYGWLLAKAYYSVLLISLYTRLIFIENRFHRILRINERTIGWSTHITSWKRHKHLCHSLAICE